MSGIQPNTDFLPKQDKKKSNEEILREMYPEYFALSEYQRRCLPATNYWRVMSGMSFIPVPKEDTRFYKYFDKRCFELYKEKLKREEKLKTNKI